MREGGWGCANVMTTRHTVLVANQSSQRQHQKKKQQSEEGAPEVDSYLVVFDFHTTRSTSNNTALNRRFIQESQRGKRLPDIQRPNLLRKL